MDGGGRKDIWIVANWKSNKTIAEALRWVDFVGPRLERRPHLKVVVCPEFTAIEEVKKAVIVNNFPLLVGAQDLSPFPPGPYTGEESASTLRELAQLVILGHSERRTNFGETDQMVEEKVGRAKEYGITTLVCVQNENTPIPTKTDLVAFEPIDAIGTDNPATVVEVSRVTEKIREQIGQSKGVLYGGSVTPQDAKQFLEIKDLDGLLVGKASLDPEEFLRIIRVAEKATP